MAGRPIPAEDVAAATALVPARPSVLARLGASLGTAMFGPGAPITISAPQPARNWDYPVGINTRTQPRAEEPTRYEELRLLADRCDLVRMAIETVKAQTKRVAWDLLGVDGQPARDAGAIRDTLRKPDRRLPFRAWLNALLEDILVLDAYAIHPRRTRGGALLALEAIDAATIRPVVDLTGRAPLDPKAEAYRQIIKGIPVAAFTSETLLYGHLNPRTWKLGGFGPVEWIQLTVNLAIRREMWRISNYTDGTIPDAIVQLPEKWGLGEVRAFQAWWDELFAGGNATTQRHRARFIPGGEGSALHWAKEQLLKDELDEWLARVVAYAFSLPPTWAVRQMNRATAETANDAALSEGLLPRLEDLADVLNELLAVHFGRPDLRWAWKDPRQPDPLKAAQTAQIYLDRAVLTVNEHRVTLGLPPVDGGDVPFVMTAGGPVPLADATAPLDDTDVVEGELVDDDPDDSDAADDDGDTQPAQTGKATSARLRKRRTVATLTGRARALRAGAGRTHRTVRRAERRLGKAVVRVLKAVRRSIVAQLGPQLAKGAALQKEAVEPILEGLDLDGFDVLIDPTADVLEAVGKRGGVQALATLRAQVGIDDDVRLPNDRIVAYAKTRAAELVGKRVLADDSLVDNPNPRYAITDSTRALLRETIAEAFTEEWSQAELADALEASYAFSAQRAKLITQTEVSRAYTTGNMAAWAESGVVGGKASILGSEHDDDDECDGNAAAGTIALTAAFPSGDLEPPYHPGCRCDVIPVLLNDD